MWKIEYLLLSVKMRAWFTENFPYFECGKGFRCDIYFAV